ncbi:hypothetical protein BCR36DRAFT_411679 [Piromyces finnis]|uniref:Uncharacterized protein n=1 Tax=Piromyces finnis TaxID=1754191 RepID=A0A1Y1VBV2_9FUNG|nr:hypothetical protein BCR36DRAFT_411679 [Piromyces finnis]|eukprot:ORX52237.1 hypothetical protein BCR36DRAFT_411679 [Piromyces finnis]
MKFSMKFSMKFILHLISSSYVLGSILSSKVGVEDLITSVSGYEGSQGCVDELSRVKNCILTATKENIIVSCNNYNTNTCQSFYKNPMNLLSSCSSNNFVNALVNSSVNLIIRDLKIKCQKDETGNECPLSEIELNIEESSNTDILNAINNSCKSKICRENTLEFLEYTSEINGKASNLLQSSITQITGAGTISEESLNSVLQDQSNNNNEIKSYIDILKSNNCSYSFREINFNN